MKKFIFILLCALLCSCHPSIAPDFAETSLDSSSSSNINADTGVLNEKNEWEQQPGDEPILCIEDYVLYQKMIATASLPADFVTYSQMENFGEFVDFICPSYYNNGSKGDYSTYLYTFSSPTGKMFILTIGSMPNADFSNVTEFNGKVSQNMRSIPSDDAVYRIKSGDMTYVYLEGKLRYINWTQNNLHFSLSLKNVIDVSSDELPTLLAALLDSTTAADALASIKASINEPAVK